jgi:hypothetical protein
MCDLVEREIIDQGRMGVTSATLADLALAVGLLALDEVTGGGDDVAAL